jgi:5'(3')-deoxyribonucleotidase
MKSPYLLLDVDGVCLDWQTGLLNYASKYHPNLLQHEDVDPRARDLVTWLGISHQQANDLIWDFHYSEDFEHLSPMPGSVEAVARFVQHYQLIAITSCGSDTPIAQARRKNLQWAFGRAFTEIHCIDVNDSKRDLLLQYPPSHWVEDHIKNALLGLECGHTCWLVDASYNQIPVDSRIGRLSTLYDLCDIII